MRRTRTLRTRATRTIAAVSACLAAVAGCTDDPADEPNVLPPLPRDAAPPDAAPAPDGGGDGGADPAGPAFYRFTRIEILQLGNQTPDSAPNFQLTTLERQWATDIEDFKLVILLEIDREAGTLRAHGGRGPSNAELCIPAPSSSDAFPAPFQDERRFTFTPDPSVTFRIYAENEGEVLNCTVDPDVFDAVPLNGVQGEATLSAGEDTLEGRLTACLPRAEADALCSCLGGDCRGGNHPRCPGCPSGAAPLTALLGNIPPQDECTTRIGETGYLIEVEFSAERIPTPSACGD